MPAPEAVTTASAAAAPSHFTFSPEETILEVRHLRKEFNVRRHLTEVAKGVHVVVKAVDDVSFQIRRGEILGLVGESGCGKTTTGKMIMKLIAPTSGSIVIDGKEVVEESRAEDILYRRKVQMIFQDPYASLNPRFKVRDALEEPLLIHHIGATRAERTSLIAEVMEKVKMTPVHDFMDRHPHMLSGGQRQRIATARTLILSPKVIVADEPVSMIDLSTREEILAMMKAVQQEMELSILYITHDISTARYFTNRIAVMYLGRIVEIGIADDVIDSPAHPYTRALIDAVCEPVSGKVNVLKDLPIKGEIPSAADIPAGCRFNPRCPFAQRECWEMPEPELQPVGKPAAGAVSAVEAPTAAQNGHFAACRRWKEI